jgi:hypothetical protein
MAESPHSAASAHLPSFITAPGETDVLMVVMAVVLLLGILMFGILFLRLHTLPERIAHKTHKIQFEIVAVLGLIALFTHMHIFWIAGLLLALIELPDFGTSLRRIATSAERMAGTEPEDRAESPRPEGASGGEQSAAPPETKVRDGHGNGAAALPARPEPAATSQKELTHA